MMLGIYNLIERTEDMGAIVECSVCGEVRTVVRHTVYHPPKLRCPSCPRRSRDRREYNRKYWPIMYSRNRERFVERGRAHAERVRSDPDKWAQRKLNHTKYSAKKRGIEFSLTEKDFVFVDTCPVLGIPLAKVPNSSGGRDGAASVDRIDNSKGYTPDNIMVMSWRANRMKADATKEELIAMARWVLKTFTDGA